MKKWIWLGLVLVLVIVVAVVLMTSPKDYSKRTFDYMGDDFSWDMTKEEAAAYIEKNAVMSWNTINVKENEVSDGYYFFDFDSTGKLWRVRFDMGADSSIRYTFMEWFGDYDDHTDSEYGGFGYYYWYGMMAGRKTEALLYQPDDDVYLHFNLEE
jgi:hypothetical protein